MSWRTRGRTKVEEPEVKARTRGRAKMEQLEEHEVKDLLEDEEIARFLDYECNYKKHKGKTWAQVYEEDRQYFHWVVTVMNPTTRTYQVFSKLVPQSVQMKNDINTAFKLQKARAGLDAPTQK